MNIVKIFKKRSESYFEILYKNIKVLQEITRVRRKKLLLKNINEQQDKITFADKRIEALFYEVYRKRFKNRELDAVVALLMKDLDQASLEYIRSCLKNINKKGQVWRGKPLIQALWRQRPVNL